MQPFVGIHCRTYAKNGPVDSAGSHSEMLECSRSCGVGRGQGYGRPA